MIAESINVLDTRLKDTPKGKWRLNIAKTHIGKAYEDILRTIPTYQLKFMVENIKKMKFSAGVPVTARKTQDDDYGLVLSYHEINNLMQASRATCLTCERDCRSSKHCQLRQTLDTIAFVTKEGEIIKHDGECAYKWI